MSAPPTAAAARRAYLVVLALRWLPTGLMVPIFVLLMTGRGLSLAEVGVAAAAQGVAIVVFELPTGGLADAIGRRPVLVLSSLVATAGLALLLVADDVTTFALAWAVMGVYRALDSGPLEAWFVDAALAAEPDRRLEHDLTRAGVVLGLSLAVGAVAGGALGAAVAGRDGVAATEPLTAMVAAALVLEVVHLVAVLILVRERRPARGLGAAVRAARATPTVVRAALDVMRRDRGLLALLGVEVLWGVGLTGIERFWQPRAAELLDGAVDDLFVLGLLGAAGWLAHAGGAALLPPLLRLVGGRTEWAAALLRILQGAAVLGLALVGGFTGLVIAYVAVYVAHGASNPAHEALLHRRVAAAERATVLSANSLVSQGSGALGGIALGVLAGAAGIPVTWAVTAAILAAAAPLYLVRGTPRAARISLPTDSDRRPTAPAGVTAGPGEQQ
ncbi:MAG: hypothetical protein AVDCRST_MAG79-2722 [uncultured Thermoleophilia bacterium]|uniref:Major facilitator superfamily (MFS) profile domain-containing protein n=1 Tax=uncultured Thermoleophilia bacterium TaxID=1497501 RepID=A0A6J4UI30_9ACTN|nr:MAG: hypothetical protein AVDCRST_MAG79-2722 [uncultured Thermoleophilia bacterium]